MFVDSKRFKTRVKIKNVDIVGVSLLLFKVMANRGEGLCVKKIGGNL